MMKRTTDMAISSATIGITGQTAQKNQSSPGKTNPPLPIDVCKVCRNKLTTPNIATIGLSENY